LDSGIGLPQDHDAAKELFAAATGFALAQTYLGQSYLRSKTAIGDARAAALFEEASAKGEPEAMVELAWLYAKGKGVPREPATAVRWLTQAAAWGNPVSIFQKGYFYRHVWGRLNNPQKAISLYLRSATAGYVPAQYAPGMCYAKGLGIQKDINQAINWLSEAAPKSSHAAGQLANYRLQWLVFCHRILAGDCDMSQRPMRSFHLPLPEGLYERLRVQAERARRPATALAREAIDRWLAEAQRAAIHEEIGHYAKAVAGSAADLDPALEAAGIEHLRGISKGRKRARK
jgi:TPR repeat protein